MLHSGVSRQKNSFYILTGTTLNFTERFDHLTDLTPHDRGEPLQPVGMVHRIGNPCDYIRSAGSLFIPGACRSQLFPRGEIKEADSDTRRSEVDSRSESFRFRRQHSIPICCEVPGEIIDAFAQYDGETLFSRRFAGADRLAAFRSEQSYCTIPAFPPAATGGIDRKAFPLQNSEQAFSFFKR